MEETKKPFPWKRLATVALAALIAFTLTKIARLSDDVNTLQSENRSLHNEIQNLRNEIGTIYDNVDRQMQEEASLLAGLDFSLGNLSKDMQQVELALSVVPKTYTDDTKLSVTVDGKTVGLVRSGSTFTGTVDVGLFVDYNQWPLLTIQSAEGTKTELLDDIDISYLFSRHLPTLYADGSASESRSDGKLQIDTWFSIETRSAYGNAPVTFVSFTLVEEVNGREISRKDITEEIRKTGETYNTHHVQTTDIAPSDDLRLYVIAEDSLGYIHKTLVCYRVENKDGSVAEAVWGGESIYDKNGNLLYGEKY